MIRAFIGSLHDLRNGENAHIYPGKSPGATHSRDQGRSDLSGDDLQEFAKDHRIDHTEKHGDMQGQEWSEFTVKG